MTRVILTKAVPGFVLTGLAICLAGCNSTDATVEPLVRQAAEMTVMLDASASTAFIASPSYAEASVKRVGEATMRQELGDSFRIMNFGDRSAGNGVAIFKVKSGYAKRLPTVRRDMEAALQDQMAKNRQRGGDGSTNITFSLENAGIRCTPRSVVVVLTDGIAEDERFSATKALKAGQPVNLPPPASPFLRGCSVEMIGVGMAPAGIGQSAQTLPNDQVQHLIAGWREYLSAAGVRPEDMVFTSLL